MKVATNKQEFISRHFWLILPFLLKWAYQYSHLPEFKISKSNLRSVGSILREMSDVTWYLIPQLSPKARERIVTSITTSCFRISVKIDFCAIDWIFGRSLTLRYLFIETDLIYWPSVQTDRTYCKMNHYLLNAFLSAKFCLKFSLRTWIRSLRDQP